MYMYVHLATYTLHCQLFSMWKVFAVFCGLTMHSVMNYEKILKANARQKVALEVLSFHASSSPEEAERVMVRCVYAIMLVACLALLLPFALL